MILIKLTSYVIIETRLLMMIRLMHHASWALIYKVLLLLRRRILILCWNRWRILLRVLLLIWRDSSLYNKKDMIRRALITFSLLNP
jgi:hypothetical protein